ncbi:snRNA-activating protein complex subunit 3-like [Gigantopelta aegis]|uniref:snRNA-activating protein complex subunit 3-like n=1 Tax=Gigantopelta aegis TaxID=1735272 RepID=UPI001B888328|nr:snRNA-activating protein complex subunit 3-like [Gigantopelta aegis]
METSSDFQVSELINVGNFINEWDDTARSCCQKLVEGTNQQYALARRMNITEETVDELTDVCSVDALLTGKEPQKETLYKQIPEDLDLYCTRFQKYELERRKDFGYKQMVARNMKYSLSENIKCSDHRQEVMTKTKSPVLCPNIVLTVCVHRPYIPGPYSKLRQDDTFLVLGTQKLTELRDVVTCVSDLSVAGDFSDNPDLTAISSAKDIFKSGFFFMEGIFYDDMRDPLNIRYSKEIIEWASEPSHGQNTYVAKNMEDTRFSDLTVRLGQPYLYMHQGNCEHIIIISDIRLLHSSDPHELQSYPFKVLNNRTRRTVCRACMTGTARWMVEKSHLTPDSPNFLCNVCFKMLLYDKNNKKIGNFEAKKFFDSAVK